MPILYVVFPIAIVFVIFFLIRAANGSASQGEREINRLRVNRFIKEVREGDTIKVYVKKDNPNFRLGDIHCTKTGFSTEDEHSIKAGEPIFICVDSYYGDVCAYNQPVNCVVEYNGFLTCDDNWETGDASTDIYYSESINTELLSINVNPEYYDAYEKDIDHREIIHELSLNAIRQFEKEKIEAQRQRDLQREKDAIAAKIKEKHRLQQLEKVVREELIDSGELFGEQNKRPPIPREVVDAVYGRDGGKCVYCESIENLQLDHIIPFSKGGATTLENLQLLCQKCNVSKSNKIG